MDIDTLDQFYNVDRLCNSVFKIIQILGYKREMKAPVYVVKPKNIFRHPFNKFDLDKPMNRQSQNEDLTDYFNYGFNEDTMNIYSKLVKRTIDVIDESINPTYFDAPSQLMRLNDQIPMDFGGFCKFFDTSVFVNPECSAEEEDYMIDYHNGERLFNFFIYIASSKNQNQNQCYPLIDFVKCMYKNQPQDKVQMCDVMDQIQKNLQKKYQQTMKKLYEKKNNPGGTSTNANNNSGKDEKNKNKKNPENDATDIAKQVSKNEKKQEKMQDSSKSQSQSSESDSQSQSSSSSESNRKKKSKNRQGRSRSKSNKKSKKNGKNKAKKITKDDKRQKNKRDKHKSKKKSKSIERSKKNEKSKKRRN